jgi:hypothetical protein
MRSRVISVAKATVGGFVLVFLVGISVISIVSVVALAAGVSAVDLGIGPLPLMSFRNGPAGYSFQSEWGIGALSYVGAAVGAAIAIRRQLTEHRAAASGGPSTPS